MSSASRTGSHLNTFWTWPSCAAATPIALRQCSTGPPGGRFAIGSSTAERVAIALIREGRVRRAHLGVGGQTLALPRRIVRHFGLVRESGVRIETIEPESPAASAELQRGDVIIALDGQPIATVDDLQRLLVGDTIGRTVEIRVVRRDRVLALPLTPRESEPIKR